MSGGRFDYIDSRLKDEIFGWTDTWRNVFEDREISELVWDVLDLIHDFDWYASGDTCKETYLKAKADFKKKWFSNRGVRGRAIVDDALIQAKTELYETFGFKEDDGNLANNRPGEWIDDRCSICSSVFTVNVNGEDVQITGMKSNYCPNCGAKMDGERKNNG